MRNRADYGTLDLVDRFMQWLRDLVPSGRFTNRLDAPTVSGAGGWDAVLPWTLGRQRIKLGVEVRLSAAAIEIDQLPRAAEGIVPVLVAPFIPARKQQLLEQAGWSYWDATGNTLIVVSEPVVVVRQRGAVKDPEPSAKPSTRLRSLKGQAASEVMVGLLAEGNVATIRDFARSHGLPASTVSRVVSLLREENYLEPNGGGPIVIPDRLSAARRWAEDYSFEKTFHARRYFSLAGPELALSRIAESGIPYAITGVRAARDWVRQQGRVASVPATEVWLYTSDLGAIERVADLAPDHREGSIRVAQADFIGREFVRRVGALQYASPWRTVGDLLSASGRLAGVGEDLATDLIENRWMTGG